MEENNKEKEVVLNIPVKMKYYIDPIVILIGAILVSLAIWYIASVI